MPTPEQTILVAFTVAEPDRPAAMEALAFQLAHPRHPVTSWWIAEDDRTDGSDCDSAVFVTPGRQPLASRLLRCLRLTPRCNVIRAAR